MKRKKQFWFIVAAFALCLFVGVLFDVLYRLSNTWEVPVDKFQKTLLQKEQHADSMLHLLANDVRAGRWSPQRSFKVASPDIVYYVYKGEQPVFWSDNSLDIGNLVPYKLAVDGTDFCYTNNAYCVVKACRVEDYTILAFILVKYRYYLNDGRFVSSYFAEGFALDNTVSLTAGRADDDLAVFAADGTYLFSLSQDEHVSYKSSLSVVSMVCYVVAFLLLLLLFYSLDYLFGASFWTLRNYLLALFVLVGITLLCIILGVPTRVFAADLFSPIYYASGIVPSLGHLALLSAVCCVAALTLYARVKVPVFHRWTAKVCVAFVLAHAASIIVFVLVYKQLYDLIYNSSLELVFYSVAQVSLYSVLAVLLMFVWLFSFVLLRDKMVFMFKYVVPWQWFLVADVLATCVAFALSYLYDAQPIHTELIGFFAMCVVIDMLRVHVKRSLRYWQLLLITFVCCLFVSVEVYSYNVKIKCAKYALVADNFATGADSSFDIYTQKLLTDIDSLLQQDKVLPRIMRHAISSSPKLLRYLDDNYFKSYLKNGMNNYTMKVFMVSLPSPSAHRYDAQIADGTLQPYTDHFYINCMKNDSYQFLGIFDFEVARNEMCRLFVVLYKLNDLSDYDALFQPRDNWMGHLSLSTAKYENGKKVFNGGIFVYPNQFDEARFGNKNVVYWNKYAHYIYRYDHGIDIIVSERHPAPQYAFLLFWTYLFMFYVLLVTVMHLLRLFAHRRYSFGNSFVARIVRAFVILVILILTVAFTTSVVFIYNRYKADQVKMLRDKMRCIEAQLQPFFWRYAPELPDDAELSFFIQDLSKLYRTDIHIYDAGGQLMATTRPYIFSAGLCGKRLNPQVFFGLEGSPGVIPETIGKLDYLASYAIVTDTNGHALAYICVPMFYSSYTVARELFSYLAVFINIYLLVLMLTAIIATVVGKRIIGPLQTLGHKLRHIQLGNGNEKIPYNGFATDEIGLLVTEYNRMVDQLTDSAQQLAQSERESAWRDMARQIAHEIKNPLTPMKLTIQQLQRVKANGGEQFDEYFGKAARTLIEQIDSLSLIASEFSHFARIPMAQPTMVDLNAKLMSEVELYNNNYENIEINYHSEVAEVYILADGEQLTQVFNNLLKNAIQAVPSTRHGIIRVELKVDNAWAVVSVADNGCGIDEAVAERLFVPNFTTKSSGMGLGLCIVKNIVQMANGSISFSTKTDEGTTFIVKFPLAKR
ncbi:MAG: sensor histidine kinase [Paludibacteraceae bacterium]